MTYHQQLENRLRDANRLILEQNEKLEEYRGRFQLHNEEYRMMKVENEKHLRCNENQYQYIQQLKSLVDKLKFLSDSRGTGLVNIYSIANGGQKCEVEYALGLATGSVDRVVRQRDMLIEESKHLGIENLNLKEQIKWLTSYHEVRPSMESNVSEHHPLCIPFSLDPLPSVPQVPPLASMDLQRDTTLAKDKHPTYPTDYYCNVKYCVVCNSVEDGRYWDSIHKVWKDKNWAEFHPKK